MKQKPNTISNFCIFKTNFQGPTSPLEHAWSHRHALSGPGAASHSAGQPDTVSCRRHPRRPAGLGKFIRNFILLVQQNLSAGDQDGVDIRLPRVQGFCATERASTTTTATATSTTTATAASGQRL